MAEQILSDGKADLISMCRAITADPTGLTRPQRETRGNTPRIRCNDCLDTILPGTSAAEEGRESMYDNKPARDSKKLSSWWWCSRHGVCAYCLLRGEVTLVEKDENLGGLLIPACKIPTKHDLDKLFQWYLREMERLPMKFSRALKQRRSS